MSIDNCAAYVFFHMSVMRPVYWDFWVNVGIFFFLNLCCFAPLPLIQKTYERRKRGSFRLIWKWSTPGPALSPPANWKRVRSSAQSLCLGALAGSRQRGALRGRWASTRREPSWRQRVAPTRAAGTEGNSAQEAEQAEKTRTRMEILQQRNKYCINMILYINAIISSATIHF